MPGDEVVITPKRGIEQPFTARMLQAASLTATWTARDLRVRYRQSVLRSAWSLLQPVTILATYGWVLTAVLDVTGDGAPYLTFAWTGIVAITFFSQALGQGVGSIQNAGPIISRIHFPREVLPLAVVGVAGFDLLVMTGTLLVVAWVQVGPPTIHLVGIVPAILVLVIWTAAITMGASALTVFRRDLNFAVPLALRVIFIATPVMYPASIVADQAPWLVDLNPLAAVIESMRDAVYREQWVDATWLGLQGLAGAVLFVAVAIVFRRLEPSMSDHV